MPFKRGDYWYTNVTFRFIDFDEVLRSKRIKKKIGTRRSEALEAEARIRAAIAAGDYDPDPPVVLERPVNLREFVTEEFLPWSAVQHSPAHASELKRMLETRILPFFEGFALGDITTKHIEDYKRLRKGQSYRGDGWKRPKRTSPATVNRELAALKVVFRQAVAWGRIDHSPAAGVGSLREAPNPPRLLTGAEVLRLIEEMPSNLKAAVGCAVYAGLRKSEIFRLRWEHVRLEERVLIVASRPGQMNKSNRDRQIPINDDLAALLQQHPHSSGEQLLFPGKNQADHIKEIRPSLLAAAKRAGIGHIGMHQLRHAFCSHCLMWGIPANHCAAMDGSQGFAHDDAVLPIGR